MRVAVTGGSGVVGSAVVRHLVAADHEVHALARSIESRRKLESMGADVVVGDVRDGGAVQRLVAGSRFVFNVAGVNELCARDAARMWGVNVDAALGLVAASARAGAERFIHTSSAVTLGEEPGTVGTEGSQHRGWFLSEYERSKTAAERMIFDLDDDIEVVAVNPASVQGPGRVTGTGALLLAAARGKTPLLVDTTFSLVDIDDCARGHLLAADKGVAGERYILSGGSLTVRSAVGEINRHLGRRRSPWFVKPALLTGVAPLAEAVTRALGRPSRLCPESARVLLNGHRYDGSKATRQLGLDYTPVRETLKRTLDWLRNEGLLEAR